MTITRNIKSFEYLKEYYYQKGDKFYRDGIEIDQSEFACMLNLYNHNIQEEDLTIASEMIRRYDNYEQPYCLYYINEFGQKFYENKRIKGHLKWTLDKNPDTIKVYHGRVSAMVSIKSRLKYNEATYGMEELD